MMMEDIDDDFGGGGMERLSIGGVIGRGATAAKAVPKVWDGSTLIGLRTCLGLGDGLLACGRDAKCNGLCVHQGQRERKGQTLTCVLVIPTVQVPSVHCS